MEYVAGLLDLLDLLERHSRLHFMSKNVSELDVKYM